MVDVCADMIYLFVLPPPNPHCEGPFLPLVLVPYSLCKCVICVSGLYLMGGLCFYFWGLTKMPMHAFQTYFNLDFLQMPTFLQLFSFKTLNCGISEKSLTSLIKPINLIEIPSS